MPESIIAVLVVLSLSGLALAQARWLDLTIEAAFLPAVSLVILGTYACALTGILEWAPLLVLVIGISCGACALALRPASGGSRVDFLKRPGIYLLWVTIAFTWFRLTDERYVWWDEFSHWGTLVKLVRAVHRLPVQGEIGLLDYPPGAALFQYSVVYWARFSEGLTYCAQALIGLAALAPLLQHLRWRELHIGVAALASACLLAFILFGGPASLLVDLVLALTWGGILASHVLSRSTTMRARLMLGLPLGALPVLKEVGWILALLCIALIGAAFFAERLMAPRPEASAGGSFRQRFGTVAISAATMMALLIAGPALAKVTWQQHLAQLQARQTFALPLSLAALRRSFSSDAATPRDRVTIARFRQALWEEPVGGTEMPLVTASLRRWRDGVSPVDVPPRHPGGAIAWAVGLLLVGLAAACCQPSRQDVVRVTVLVIGLGLGCVAYLAAHLLAYLYAFSEYEGTRVASFGRYVAIYLLGWSIVTIAVMVRASTAGAGARRVVAQGLLLLSTVACVALAPFEAARFVAIGARPHVGMRWSLEPKMSLLRETVTPSDRVRVIVQHSNGYEHRLALYEMTPATSRGCWSIGTPFGPQDVWTCPMSVAEFARELDGMTLLFIVDPSKTFWNEFGGIFSPNERGHVLYRINRDAAGALSLHAIG